MFRHVGHLSGQLQVPLLGSALGTDSTDDVQQWLAANQEMFPGSLGCQEL